MGTPTTTDNIFASILASPAGLTGFVTITEPGSVPTDATSTGQPDGIDLNGAISSFEAPLPTSTPDASPAPADPASATSGWSAALIGVGSAVVLIAIFMLACWHTRRKYKRAYLQELQYNPELTWLEFKQRSNRTVARVQREEDERRARVRREEDDIPEVEPMASQGQAQYGWDDREAARLANSKVTGPNGGYGDVSLDVVDAQPPPYSAVAGTER